MEVGQSDKEWFNRQQSWTNDGWLTNSSFEAYLYFGVAILKFEMDTARGLLQTDRQLRSLNKWASNLGAT